MNKKEIKNNHPTLSHKRTFGQISADVLTSMMGSWTFILIFIGFLLAWIFVNAYFLISYKMGNPWDPYPFILLNLVLSCLAALQAPIILMSQNREAQKDRLRAEYDYAVNRKAEKEIQELKEHIIEIKSHVKKKRS